VGVYVYFFFIYIYRSRNENLLNIYICDFVTYVSSTTLVK
jgi:hypothetical protein